jgi:molybdopterin-containing oxidoreductase family membrane subunit
MEVEYTQVKSKSKGYYLLFALFGVMLLGGVVATYIMYRHGLYLSGMTNRVPWGLQIVMSVFYIGLSEGSFLVSGLYGIFGKLDYKPFARVTAYVAVLFLIAGLLSILTDQGRIDRVLTMPFSYANPMSMFSVNPPLYVGLTLICFVYMWALFKEKGRLTRFMSVAVVLWALGVHTGTGAIFAFVSRELFHSPLLPVMFVAAANSSGVALMIIMMAALFKITKRYVDLALMIWLGRLLAVFVVVAMYIIFVDNIHRVYMVGTRAAAIHFLFGGFHSVLFWGGLILIGSIIPALILFKRTTGTSLKWILFSCVLVVFGVWCERYLIVIPGQIVPPEIFPGMEIVASSVNEGVATYGASALEVLQAFGVFGLIGLLFMGGLRHLNLMPMEARLHAGSEMLKYHEIEWEAPEYAKGAQSAHPAPR